jgi:glycine cleavage system H lipoate-binding protein
MKCSVENNQGHQIVPETERCVWMTAGILTYQIFDRQFDCDQCPLDQAMRMHLVHKEGRLAKAPWDASMIAPQSETCRYSNGHCWVEHVGTDLVKIGIEPMLAGCLVSAKAVVFPSMGQEIKRNDPLCWIVVDESTLQLHSPVDGNIHAINVNLLDNPQQICDPTIDSPWLLQIRTDGHGFSSSTLLPKREIQRQYDEDLATFNRSLTEALGGSDAVGMTLQDGGLPFHTVPTGMSRKIYYEILKRAFRL